MIVADDGCRLWTRTTGSGSPVICVHGGPGWWDVLDELAAILAKNATVHQWDQRGAGRSDRRGPYTLARFVADLDAVRDQHGHEKVTLVGHSWGATLALQYAVTHRHRVDRLVLVSSVGLEPVEASYRRRVEEFMASAPCDDDWLVRISTGFADRATALESAERLMTPRFEANKECAEALVAEVRNLPDRVSACRALAVPALIVHGALDLRPPHVTDSLLAALPDARRVIIEGAAHYPWLEAPEPFAEPIRSFLR